MIQQLVCTADNDFVLIRKLTGLCLRKGHLPWSLKAKSTLDNVLQQEGVALCLLALRQKQVFQAITSPFYSATKVSCDVF